MDEPPSPRPKSHSTPQAATSQPTTNGDTLKPHHTDNDTTTTTPNILTDSSADYLLQTTTTNPSTPSLSRTNSLTGFDETFTSSDTDTFIPPVDRLTIFDILENFALPQRLERVQNAISDNASKLRKQRAKLTERTGEVLGKWKGGKDGGDGGVGGREGDLEKYRRRMRASVERLNQRWEDARTVTMKEKISFVSAVLNIFISAYLIGGWPEWFHYWYTIQLAYFMPIRWYKYHKIGYHYFLADLCYFVNLLMIISIWFFPQSKRLFISTYCLAMGNNAVAIVMWRNSLVFHSLDKVTSLFIHIMPCATLHCIIHLLTPQQQLHNFPAIHTIKHSPPTAPEHYSLTSMLIWATLPYAVWQATYHLLITRRKSSKIAAGRPTSFTWLRKSYSQNPLGKFVLGFPEQYQEGVFMGIQYGYAMLTLVPCPLWFWYRWASAGFLGVVFAWASWNGATYYIDVFGRRMERELEGLKKEVARMEREGFAGVWSPEIKGMEDGGGKASGLELGASANGDRGGEGLHRRGKSEVTTDGEESGNAEATGSGGMGVVNGIGAEDRENEGKKNG